MDTNMAKTDNKNGSKPVETPPVATTPDVPVTGKIQVHFLKDDTIPERKALGRAEGSGEWTAVAKALAEKPGRVAELYFTTDAKEANSRRSALIQAAERAGIEMNLAKTAVRDSGKRDGEAIVFCMYGCVATPEVKKAQAAKRAEKEAKLAAEAKEKGFKTVEEYKASLPKRGRPAAPAGETGAQA